MSIQITTDTSRFMLISGYILVIACMPSNLEGSVPSIDLAAVLRSKGYPSSTPEQIVEAAKSNSYFIRNVALELLTERTGKQAIPALRQGLEDPRMEVRWRAAHLLGTLGDMSGVGRMRQDLSDFAPNNGAPMPLDPNVTDLHERREQERKRNLHLGYALRAARVLAELGDRRGYELAARMALDGARSYQRTDAVRVLVEIAKLEDATLAAESIDPVTVLCAVADSEENQSVFSTLVSSMRKLRKDIAVRVLERAAKSPHQSEKMRSFAQFVCARAKTKRTPPKCEEAN